MSITACLRWCTACSSSRFSGAFNHPGQQPDWLAFFEIEGFHWTLAGLFISHFFSFCMNFMKGGEIDRTDLGQLMGAPYGRVMILHVVILLGAFLVLSTGQATWALILLILIKIPVDLAARRRAHEKLNPALAKSGPNRYDLSL